MLYSFKAIEPTPGVCNISGNGIPEFCAVSGSLYLAGSWEPQKLVELGKESGLRCLRLPYFGNRPWQALEKAGCENVVPLKASFGYNCVILEETRHAFVPVAIQTTVEGLEKYRAAFQQQQGHFYGAGVDMDYLCVIDDLEFQDAHAESSLNRFQRLVLGSGYTFACLPSDGDSVLERVDIELDNGDRLLGIAFNFYGK